MIDLISNKPALPVLLDFQSALPNPPTCCRWLFSLDNDQFHKPKDPIEVDGCKKGLI